MSLVDGHLLVKFKMSKTGARAHHVPLLNVNDGSFTFVRFRFDSLNKIHFFRVLWSVYVCMYVLYIIHTQLDQYKSNLMNLD